MHIDLYVAVAGLLVGFTVGLTGMGGGALMTPILILLFKVQPLTAVSSDLVASMIMKPVGASVHQRRGTVNWSLVRWLAAGSIPSAFLGVFILKHLGNGAVVEGRLKLALGVALMVASTSIVAKGFLQLRRARRREVLILAGRSADPGPFSPKPLPTVLMGVFGGGIVGMTSVGSGSLIIVSLLLLYPMLSAKELVGTDLMQAIPLVASAALGHILFGDFRLSLTASVLLGSLPGVYLGARLSSRAPDGLIRPALVFVLLASGLKLLDLSTTQLVVALAAFVVLALPIWGVVDAVTRPRHHWEIAGLSRRLWVGVQAGGAMAGVGFLAAIVYLASVRPKLNAAGLMSIVSVRGDEILV
ncbi:MAG TPA: sulfite exporter TauE/SafE family protein [Actinomycetota bacterium]